jgi:hypothetical protein
LRKQNNAKREPIQWSRAKPAIIASIVSFIGLVGCVLFHLAQFPRVGLELKAVSQIARCEGPFNIFGDQRFISGPISVAGKYEATESYLGYGVAQRLVTEIDDELLVRGFTRSDLTDQISEWRKGDFRVRLAADKLQEGSVQVRLQIARGYNDSMISRYRNFWLAYD